MGRQISDAVADAVLIDFPSYEGNCWREISRACRIVVDEHGVETVSVDHVIPVSRGGSNRPENIELVHGLINSMKRQMTKAEFVGICHLVAEHCENEASEEDIERVLSGDPWARRGD